ncbi:MAG: SDR family NAD(P)-dependent oxidoreductase [Candidatus Edwardsbacteria bacterium]|nr:SDR family NAD(P)-dependent oxidoreductase [Candidatus Edwardsbacteria bacterium]
MNWNNKTVLVTGAAGFIGSHLCEDLAARGARVRAFVRYTGGGAIGNLRCLPPELLGTVDVYRGDLRDFHAVRAAMTGCRYVFHLGALIAIPYSYRHPVETAEVNVMGTLNVLMAARETGVTRLVHTSTSEVYGTGQYVPIDERHPLKGQSPYSASKIGADKLAESFHASFGLPLVTVRPFNTFGPRQSARAVIPTIAVQALTRDTVRLGSLAPKRDFTYVKDTSAGFIAAAEAPDTVCGEVINLGTGQYHTIGETARRIIRLSGRKTRIVTDRQRIRPGASEVLRLLADNRKAARLLGWKPRCGFDQGLEQTVDWIRENLDQFRADEYTI